MATLQIFKCFPRDLGLGKHNFLEDTLKVALTSAPVSLSIAEELADVTQIAPGNGYTSGGYTLASVGWVKDSYGISTLSALSFSIIAVGGTMAAFRYLVLYNDTAPSKPLIALISLDSLQVLLDGQSIPINFNVGGILRAMEDVE